MKNILMIGCIIFFITGCTEEEKTQVTNQVTTTIEKKMDELGLKEDAKAMATASIQKIQEAYVGEQKVMMDNAYKFGQEYMKLISEQAKATLSEMEKTTTPTTTTN